MAAKAAQRSSHRPPPPPPINLHPPSVQPGFGPTPSYPPQYGQQPGHASSRTGGSGLIHLHALQAQSAPPVQRNIEIHHSSSPPRSRRARLESNPFESKGSRGLLVGFIVGLLVIGAAYGLAMKRGIDPVAAGRGMIASLRNWDAPPPSPQFTVSETKPAAVETTPATVNVAKPVETTAPSVRGVDPTKLPAVGTNAVAPAEPTDVLAEAKAPAKVAKAVRPAVEPPAPKAEPAPAPKPAPPPVAKAAPEPKPEPPPRAAPEPEPTGLAGAIKKAVGPQEAAPKSVAQETPDAPAMRGDIPEVPPQGAIAGAIGSHRQAARACVEGHDSASRATIVFASTGKVQSVNVAGPAAGTNAEACIVRALSKSAVGPFRRPSFSVTTTISPP
jgi:outer membrane biosynthesis protein TonB